MPLYEYRCTQCGYQFEKIQHFNATPETECPRCHGVLERPLSAPALQFKGAGWYVNDYSSKTASSGASSSSADSTAAPASDAKPSTESAKPAAAEAPAKPSTPTPSSTS